jgi:hypothetical protein
MGRVTDLAPAGLVPAAWLVTAGAHRGLVAERTLLIALVVMDALMLAFLIAGRDELTGPVLHIWRRVLVAGFVATVAGTVGLWLRPNNGLLLSVALYGWMVLPAMAYLQTGQLVPDRPYRPVYRLAGAGSALGALAYAGGHAGLLPAGTAAGLALVGLSQSVGMVTAAVQNS